MNIDFYIRQLKFAILCIMKRSTDGYKFSFGRVSPNATPKFTSIEIPVDELTKERRSSSLKKISKLKTDFSQI